MVQLEIFADSTPESLPEGFRLWRARLDEGEQIALLDDIALVLDSAPPYRPRMRNGTPLINEMSNCGALGWYSDERGYRYIERHPDTNRPWPAMPDRLTRLARALAVEISSAPYMPDACLVNLYGARGRLNLHVDSDEADFAWPIISISLGDDCIFQLGGMSRKDAVRKIRLRSGDVVALSGKSRKRFHGVEKLLAVRHAPRHALFARWPRINLTLRRAG